MKNIIFDQRIKYLFWGVLTTLVYFVVRIISMSFFSNPEIPVVISETVSIIFAFLVNKFFVFNTEKQSKELTSQIVDFFIGRGIAFGIDFVLTYLLIQKFADFFIKLIGLNRIDYHAQIFQIPLIHNHLGSPELINSFLVIIFIQIVIIIFNYFISKYWAFK
ncbi:hypothetical protein BGL34_05660 [Fructilactobacillus lindneri]|nr:hypothetical protein BGL31_05125 [Fructilactobacillus lindneri]POH23295.1 hypothetical protein BHU33_05415 [Fructilactobacillus lindneri DSM 20690 = JCM 11027]POG99277.1 hypothetical protein BGL32_05150 [Fructilactobacillus lindneri]POH01914.1 hypothetical protein BGL33_04920 [Fructilactobacillus lindneri]POH05329.1 hypothetical protein BGL34_05660 [Fructilactobacillus lindneri]